MERLYKLSPGVVFTIDAKTWEEQFGGLDFPNNYVEIDKRSIVKA